jgi:hypothetical protein
VNSSKLGPTVARRNEKLVKLLGAIGDLPLASGESGGNRFADNTIDLFGDAYEYLMQIRELQKVRHRARRHAGWPPATLIVGSCRISSTTCSASRPPKWSFPAVLALAQSRT